MFLSLPPRAGRTSSLLRLVSAPAEDVTGSPDRPVPKAPVLMPGTGAAPAAHPATTHMCHPGANAL